MNLSKLSPVSQFLLVIGTWAILIFAVCLWVKHETSQEAQQSRYLKNNPAMGVPLSQLQWGERPSTEEVEARAAKRNVVISQAIQSEPRRSAIIEMNAANSRWHNHRAESLRLKKDGQTYDAIREDRLADIAYDEFNMYYHRIQAGNFPTLDHQDRLAQSRHEEAALFAEINKGIIDRATASKAEK